MGERERETGCWLWGPKPWWGIGLEGKENFFPMRQEGQERAVLRLEEVGKELTKLPFNNFYFLHEIGGQRFIEGQ